MLLVRSFFVTKKKESLNTKGLIVDEKFFLKLQIHYFHLMT